jgi:hypothetical protein
MAQLIPNSFASYLLTEQEETQGQILSTVQKMVLQNKLSTIAEEKLHLTYDASAPLIYAQKEAELTGQMGVIQWLLDTSNQVEEELAAKLKAVQEDSQPE